MDVVGFVIGAIIFLFGLGALLTAILHSAPSKTSIFRLISWPKTGANDRVALPLALLITCMGAIFLLTSFPGRPSLLASLPFLIVGVVSAVVIGLRRSEA